MHAIGDRAFDQATRALKEALDDYPRTDHRHGIIHDCLPTDEGMRICADYGITMPVQSAFINWKQEPDAYLESIMGAERCARLNPIRSFLDRGILVSFGSDAPCTTPDPIVWMDKAVNNPNPDEAVSIQDALRMCTYNGNYTTFSRKNRGHGHSLRQPIRDPRKRAEGPACRKADPRRGRLPLGEAFRRQRFSGRHDEQEQSILRSSLLL